MEQWISYRTAGRVAAWVEGEAAMLKKQREVLRRDTLFSHLLPRDGIREHVVIMARGLEYGIENTVLGVVGFDIPPLHLICQVHG